MRRFCKGFDFPICGCSDDSVFELLKKNREELMDGIDNLGLKNIIGMKGAKYEELNENGKELVEMCVDFLIYEKQRGYCGTKYIALWSFIYECLKIPQNSGYDYYLMNYLDHIGLIEHGSG